MKEKLLSILFVGILFLGGIYILMSKDQEFSTYERRKLMTKQELKKDIFHNLDPFFRDQLPWRNHFLALNSFVERSLLQNKESNQVYLINDFMIEKNDNIEEKKLNGFISKINKIQNQYLTNHNIFFSIIPDKSYFLDSQKYPKMDFDYMIQKLKKEINIPYIDIMNDFQLEDYYKTDIHLKQPSYLKILNKLEQHFSLLNQKENYQKKQYDNFQGSSFSKAPLYASQEPLVYLTNETIEKAKVNYLEYNETPVYTLDKLGTIDSYSVFLNGPSAILSIENSNADSEKELIIFRDSFASSLAPLLIPYYKKITLIDLRYIDMSLTNQYIDYEKQDILFLYSTLIVKESNLLKVT
ncbi:MAG: hypothetical protein HFH86_02565 [Bacilli bacterium]|nr:hypothetical protein [Bacilli bacterium]